MVRIFLLVFASVSLVIIGDTAGKMLVQDGAPPLFVAWSRFALAAVVLLPLLRIRVGEWVSLADWRVLLRAALIAGGIGCILFALRTEPIGAVFAAIFIAPGVSYALSVLLLGERASWQRTVLLAIGFGGVLLVVRPGGAVSANILFALAAGVFYGSYLAATRWLANGFRPGFLLVSQLVVGAVLLAPLGAPVLPVLGAAGWALVLLSALASAAGNYLIVQVSRTTPASVIAPLLYTQLISATAAGVLVFGDRPDALTLAGLTVILMSGLATLRLAH